MRRALCRGCCALCKHEFQKVSSALHRLLVRCNGQHGAGPWTMPHKRVVSPYGEKHSLRTFFAASLVCCMLTPPARNVCSTPPASLLRWIPKWRSLKLTETHCGHPVCSKTLSAIVLYDIYCALWINVARNTGAQSTPCTSATKDNIMRAPDINNKKTSVVYSYASKYCLRTWYPTYLVRYENMPPKTMVRSAPPVEPATVNNAMRVPDIHSKKLWCSRMHKTIVCENSMQHLLCSMHSICLGERCAVHPHLPATMDNTRWLSDLHNTKMWCCHIHENILCQRSVRQALCALQSLHLKTRCVVHPLLVCVNFQHNANTWYFRQKFVVSPYA
jgi:hypothetical protein